MHSERLNIWRKSRRINLIDTIKVFQFFIFSVRSKSSTHSKVQHKSQLIYYHNNSSAGKIYFVCLTSFIIIILSYHIIIVAATVIYSRGVIDNRYSNPNLR